MIAHYAVCCFVVLLFVCLLELFLFWVVLLVLVSSFNMYCPLVCLLVPPRVCLAVGVFASM